MTATCYANGKIVCEIDLDTKKVTQIMPKDEWEDGKKKMMKNVGEEMSRYLQTHPKATMWDT